MRILFIYLLLALVGGVDYLTGAEFHLGCLYLVVAAIASWNLQPRAVVCYTAATVLAWASAEWFSGVHYSRTWLYCWNVCNDVGVVAITSIMVSKAKTTLDQRQQLIQELGQSLLKNSRFKELVPVCRMCHELRVDPQFKSMLQSVLQEDASADEIGGVCADCLDASRRRVANIPVEIYFQSSVS